MDHMQQEAARLDNQLDILNRLRETTMDIRVVLMCKQFPIRDLVGLSPGTTLSFGLPASTPALIEVNAHLFARGEVVQVEERFGIRLTEINESR